MSTFFALVWLAANIAMVVFIVKAIKEKEHEAKKKKRKIWLLCLLVAFISLVIFVATADTSDYESDENSELVTSETDSAIQDTTDMTDIDEAEDEQAGEVESDSIELVAGELGEYGKSVVMSAGTDCEEELIVYYVPAGTYTVKNLGDYRTQITVYEGFAKNTETGYDEYTNTGDIVLLNADESGEIEVPDGWFIEIQEPAHISLTAK